MTQPIPDFVICGCADPSREGGIVLFGSRKLTQVELENRMDEHDLEELLFSNLEARPKYILSLTCQMKDYTLVTGTDYGQALLTLLGIWKAQDNDAQTMQRTLAEASTYLTGQALKALGVRY